MPLAQSGDTTGMLKALVEGGARGAVLGVLCDPEAAAAAHAAGVGATLELALGGKSGAPGQAPYVARFEVLALGDGRFTATGPMWLGSRMRLDATLHGDDGVSRLRSRQLFDPPAESIPGLTKATKLVLRALARGGDAAELALRDTGSLLDTVGLPETLLERGRVLEGIARGLLP